MEEIPRLRLGEELCDLLQTLRNGGRYGSFILMSPFHSADSRGAELKITATPRNRKYCKYYAVSTRDRGHGAVKDYNVVFSRERKKEREKSDISRRIILKNDIIRMMDGVLIYPAIIP